MKNNLKLLYANQKKKKKKKCAPVLFSEITIKTLFAIFEEP